jgi:WD40 repeat protein/tetratricopeptide (TPR) repeat protein
MSESHRVEDVAVHNERSLKKLAWAIEASVGQFKLFLARCNYTNLRSQLVERLQELTSVEIRILELNRSEKTLYARIQAELDSEQPDALMVFGLESVGDLDELLSATNQVREEFRKNFHFPLVLWVNDEVMEKLLRLAPDFESWATTVAFLMAPEDLANFLIQTAEQWFTDNLILTLEACLELQAQLEAAQKDLLGYEQVFTPELEANCESLLGFTKRVSNQIDVAIAHYQRSLVFWQQTNNLERQAKLLDEISFCYYLKAPPYRYKNYPVCQDTRHCVQKYLRVIEQLQRPDLIANSILRFGEVLGYLQDWEQLQVLTQQALQVHQSENKPIELARDYGFLAEAALAQERWNDASEFARKALEVLLVPSSNQSPDKLGVVYELLDKSVVRNDPTLYLFIRAKSQQHLGQLPEAISNLEAAREVGILRYDPQLYLDILSHLQRLYFEQKDYLKAFEIKQERQSIERQYGLRAFIGAGRIQPQRQARLALKQVVETLHQTCPQETVAPEITASGRQLDVERLIERIGRNDCKLIVIHGESGVGKSSLVYGGLVPALKQKAMGTSDVLPVAMRVYTSWVEQLGKFLAGVLEEKGIHLATSLDSEAAILEQLQQSESRNLRTVLIFDQFEEFFFVYPAPGQRRRFFEFVGACLNILPVKVILSLRKDYLHYLLECNRLPSMKIISNDILTKNVLYELGNFSPADAKAIVQRLTEVSNFHLEPALIEQLVQDLAGNLGEVRPIELQIVGAQLQTDNITTLAEYRERGQKEELVKRYLAEVVSDCGDENQQAAELVLYLLTDEKGTRPLKTRVEVERDLQALSSADFTAEASRLDLVLEIFVDSGLVVLCPELIADRYQLVHDYLAAFIRQQQEPKLKELIAELEKERKQRQKAEEERKRIEEELERTEQAKQILEARVQQVKKDLAAVEAERERVNREVQEAQIKLTETELELAGVGTLQQFEFSQIEALLAAMRAGQELKVQLQEGYPFEKHSALSPLLALQQILNAIQEKNWFQGHQGEVWSVSFSLDGQYLATASTDSTARLWNLQGKQLVEFKGHQGEVWSVNFSPNGQRLATASEDGTARLWDLQGKQLVKFKGHQGGVKSVNFSPNGQCLATGSSDGTARLWDLQGNQLVEFKGHQDWVNSVTFSPNGQYLATASSDDTARLWDLQGKQLVEFKGHQDEVWLVTFSPDGQSLATASSDGARLWDLQGKQLVEFKGHQGWVWSVSFSPDGQYLATASGDGTARLWGLQGKQLAEFKGHQGWVCSVCFSPDGHYLTTGSGDRTTRLWKLKDEQVVEFNGHQGWVWSASFSPNGQYLATASSDRTARLWDLQGKQVVEFNGHQGWVWSASFSPDGQYLATASDDCTAGLWDLQGKQLVEFKGHQRRVRSISFSPDGQYIATTSDDPTARLWDLQGKQLVEFNGHQAGVRSIRFSRDGQYLATASSDRTARLWDLQGNQLVEFKGHQHGVRGISFSPDGQYIATTSSDRTARLWDLQGKQLVEFKGHQGEVWSVSFSPDGQYLATASSDRTARLWNLQGKQLAEFKGHQGWVWSVSFSPDGQYLATASGDGTARLWRIENLDQLLARGYEWLRDYLTTNPNVSESDRHLCYNIKIQE